ncbi:hypothetical protein L3Y34_009941 [Caenorhabditis briggsae]|uniref:Protein kinase domain-containing protein n=1 Tax=Caenorhabditis briggsae TaxID=6238 RepID=A0AAE9A6U8_CAEBR|nr:hypothetical protein L3Y34_009941 [Caenorhabditis briggsae]
MEQVGGEYEYDKRDDLGRGQFAIVYKGRVIENPDVAVAIKAVSKKEFGRHRQQLGKEIKILRDLAKIQHENVVRLIKCSETQNHVFLVMEYCNGGDLADYLYASGTLAEECIQHFIIQISRALEVMNKLTIVHRDLKPQNILLCYNPKILNPTYSEITVKLADFGFARILNNGIMTQTFCGSPMYMAPEILMGEMYDARADLYSIGVIFYQCLTGKPPFPAQNPMQLRNIYEKSLELKPNVPEWCSDVLEDLLVRIIKRNVANRMTFNDFYTHPFLTDPLKPSPSKRILENAPMGINQMVITPKPVRRTENAPVMVKNSPKPAAVRNIMSKSKVQKAANPFLEQKAMMPEEVDESFEDFTFLPMQPKRSVVAEKEDPPKNNTISTMPKDLPPLVPVNRAIYLKMREALEARRNGGKKPVEKDIAKKVMPIVDENPVFARRTTLPNPSAEEIQKLSIPHPRFVILGDGKRLQVVTVDEKEKQVENQQVIEEKPKINEQPDFSSLPIQNLFIEEKNSSSKIHESIYNDAFMFPFASAPTATPSNLILPKEIQPLSLKIIPASLQPLIPETFHCDQHKQLLAKLQFVNEIVNELINLADQKSNPLAVAMKQRKLKTNSSHQRAEQLAVLVRALHMLSSAMLLAQEKVDLKELEPTKAVQQVLNQLNDKYHFCVMRSQQISKFGVPAQDPSLPLISAERVIYRHSIDLCEDAALDELFGNPHRCSERYQTAYLLLHVLVEQANCDKDRDLLKRYRIAVVNRLRILERQGYVAYV